VGGVLLLVVSIAVGTKVVGSASQTTAIWAISHDLSAGTVLSAGDLVARDVNLGASSALYASAGSALSGQVLSRPLNAGELIPVAALGEVSDSRVLSVSVAPGHLAPGVTHGSVADLYLITGRAGMVGGDVETRLLHDRVTIQSVTAPSSGGLSGAVSGGYQVALLLTAADADALVRELPLGEPVIVLHSGGVATDRAGE
jgi:hypothetical protein